MSLRLTDAAASSMTIFLLATMCPRKSPENVAYFEQRLLHYFRGPGDLSHLTRRGAALAARPAAAKAMQPIA